MGKKDILDILSGSKDQNVKFQTLKNLLISLGFNERIKGSHHIYTKLDIEEIINIQLKGNKAKPYQVKQVIKILS